jgi:IS4 transposase
MLSEKKRSKDIKKLAVLARQNINSRINLKRTKSIGFEDKHYFALVLLVSLFCAFAEGTGYVANQFGSLPKGDSLLAQLQKLKDEDVREQFRKIFEWQFKNIFRFRLVKPKVILAIDVTDKPTYSKNHKDANIVGGKPKASTSYFFRFATIQIADRENPITLYALHCNKETTNEHIVEELITQAKRLVRIRCVLIDRSFYDTKVFNKLEQLGVKYLMPCKYDNKTDKMFEKYLSSNYEVQPYFCQNKAKEYADFKLIMIRLDEKTEIGFVTNIHFIKLHRAKYYIELYKRRWNIETGYRLQNMFLAKTCSINPSVRLFYFCYAVALHNLWVMIKSKVENNNFSVPVLMFSFVLILTVVAEFLDVNLLMEVT